MLTLELRGKWGGVGHQVLIHMLKAFELTNP